MQAEKKKKRSCIQVAIISFIVILCALILFGAIVAGFESSNLEEEPVTIAQGSKTPTDQPESSTPTLTPLPDQPALQHTDFFGVCEGHAIEIAHKYDRNEDKVHPVFYYPGWQRWEILYADSSDEDTLYQVELVACGSRVSEEWALSCVYDNGINLIMYNAKYKVEIYEARTGQRLDSFTVYGTYGPIPKCPRSVAGPTSLKVRKTYAVPDEEKVISFIDQYAKP